MEQTNGQTVRQDS